MRSTETDHGSKDTGAGWIATLTEADIIISIDNRGPYLDNIFIQRLWPPLKQESVYLHEMTADFKEKELIDSWIGFCNAERPYAAVDKRRPDTAYFGQAKIRKAA